MKRLLNIVLLLVAVTAGTSWGQSQPLDSLKQVYLNSSDTAKVLAHIAMSKELSKNNISDAITEASKALEEAQAISFAYGEAKAYIVLSSLYHSKGDLPVAEKLAFVALEKMNEVGSKSEIGDVTNLLGLIYMGKAQYYLAEKYYREALFIYLGANDSVGVVIGLHNLGVINFYKGEYDKVAWYYIQSLQLAEKMKLNKYITANQLNLGILFSVQKDFVTAKRYIKMALLRFREQHIKSGEASALAHLGTAYFNEGYLDSAFISHKQALVLYSELDDEKGIAQSQSNMADIYAEQGNYKEAEKLFASSLQLRKKNEDRYGIVISYAGLANTSLGLGNDSYATLYFDSALTLCKEIGTLWKEAEIYQSLAQFQAKTGKYKNAYESLLQYSAIKDTLTNHDKMEVVKELEAKYQNEKHGQEIVAQKAQINMLNKYNRLFLISIIILCIAVLLGIMLARGYLTRARIDHQNKLTMAEKNREIAENQQKILENELEKSRLEQEKIMAELNFKKKELTQLALHINQQNDFLESLKENIRQSQTSELKMLERDIETKLNIDKQRENFEMNIALIHEEFYKNLQDKFPQLTENEKKLCAMLRLNLSSKEIAAIQNISPKSVDMNRYRLRKKLNLNNEEDIVRFLGSV